MPKIDWKTVWQGTIKLGIALIMAIIENWLINFQSKCTIIGINFPCNLIAGFLFVVLLLVSLGMVHLCWLGIYKLALPKYHYLIKSFQKERNVDFSPAILWNRNENTVLVIVHFPQNAFLYSNTNAIVQYQKNNHTQKRDYKTKSDLYVDLITQQIKNPVVRENAIWEDWSSSRLIWKNSTRTLNIFTIDESDNIFYLTTNKGRPKYFWNEDSIANLSERSFAFGKHSFELKIFGIDFWGRKLVQNLPFTIGYGPDGLTIESC